MWTQLVDGATERALVRRIEAEYATDAGEAARSIGEFLDLLIGEDLLISEIADDIGVPVGEPITPALLKTFIPPTFEKFTDMEDMLLLDPIHEVDEEGWPMARKDHEP
jgi:hypothetical protein